MTTATRILSAFLLLHCGSASTCAELHLSDLVIDEFDDTVAVPLPAFGSVHADQNNIGALSAVRRTKVVDSNLRASGEYGAVNSSLAANISGATPHPNAGTSLLSLSFAGEYELSTPLNLAGLGYDALAIDFRAMDSWLGYVPRVDTFLRTTQQASLFYSSQYDIPLSDSPFTLLFPLDTFGDRGVGLGDDFDDVVSVWFYVYPVYLTGASPDMTFSMQIDRIRFTTLAVPEPASMTLLVASLVAASLRRRGRLGVNE